MTMKIAGRCMLAATTWLTAAAPLHAQPSAANAQQRAFEQRCAVCHDNAATRAPSRSSLAAMSTDFIVAALTDGIMKVHRARRCRRLSESRWRSS